MRQPRFGISGIFWVLVLLLGCGVLPVGDADIAAAAETQRNGRLITIDFDNVDITIFIKYISELTGKNFVVDPRVVGTVTVMSPLRISEQDAYRVFESVLEVHGYTTVTAGSVTKIVPSAEARTKGLTTIKPGDPAVAEDRMVTRLVPLVHTTPVEMQRLLQPLAAKTSLLLAHTPSGMLIITDTMSNISRLLGIVKALDVEHNRDEIVVLPLRHASAENLAVVLNTIFRSPTGGQEENATGLLPLKVVPYERINLLIVIGNQSDTARVRKLAETLDSEIESGEGNIHVVYLQNARASELAKVLQALPQETKQDTAPPTESRISAAVSIMPDEETNSLIITASRAEFSVLEGVIKKLDIPRRMVYLEALIMEVDADRSFNVGVQWITGSSFDGDSGAVIGGFSGNPAYGTVSGLGETGISALSAGMSLGVLKKGIEIGGVTFPNIAAVLNAYRGDSDINIISNPQILTTDNKKAEILVGENVPYITSQNTTSSEQDYTQYEYRDVATRMSIIPQISQSGTLRLEIATEVTRLKQSTDEDQFRPTTFKRSANTTVIVRDRETVVIGGIIGQESEDSEYKVPLIGDIPLLGWLFKTRSNERKKVNMFIFITPRIMTNPADIAAVTDGREKRMDDGMQEAKRVLEEDAPAGDHALLLVDRGYEALRRGELETARDHLLNALQIDGQNPYALLNLGVVYQQRGEFSRALELYRRVIETGTDAIALPPENYHGNWKDLSLVGIARSNIEYLESLHQ